MKLERYKHGMYDRYYAASDHSLGVSVNRQPFERAVIARGVEAYVGEDVNAFNIDHPVLKGVVKKILRWIHES